MKYKMTCHITVTAYCEVEAANTTEAIEKASGLDVVIGGTNSGADDSECWVIEQPDGTPQEINAEQCDE